MTCALSEDSDEPGHLPSLISLLCPHEETLGLMLPIECTAKTLTRLGGCPSWSESLLGAQVILLVLSCCGSNDFDSCSAHVNVRVHFPSIELNVPCELFVSWVITYLHNWVESRLRVFFNNGERPHVRSKYSHCLYWSEVGQKLVRHRIRLQSNYMHFHLIAITLVWSCFAWRKT